jgi:hypothetical protein
VRQFVHLPRISNSFLIGLVGFDQKHIIFNRFIISNGHFVTDDPSSKSAVSNEM